VFVIKGRILHIRLNQYRQAYFWTLGKRHYAHLQIASSSPAGAIPSPLHCSINSGNCMRCANTCTRGHAPLSHRRLWRLVYQQSLRKLLVQILRNNRMPFDIGMPGIMPVFIAYYLQLLRIVRAESII